MHHDKTTEDRRRRTEDREPAAIGAAALCRPSSVFRSRGFTLIELLVTMALIAVIMPVAMHTIGLCTRIGGQSRREIEAASLAKTKLTELLITQDWENTSKRGDFGTDWPGYEWTVTVANWTDSIVRQISLTVSWRSMGRLREVTLSTLVYPEES